jgi:hypothetical protein
MGKQIKINFILDVEEKMTPNILTFIMKELFEQRGWKHKGIVENVQQYDNEVNSVRINYGK